MSTIGSLSYSGHTVNSFYSACDTCPSFPFSKLPVWPAQAGPQFCWGCNLQVTSPYQEGFTVLMEARTRLAGCVITARQSSSPFNLGFLISYVWYYTVTQSQPLKTTLFISHSLQGRSLSTARLGLLLQVLTRTSGAYVSHSSSCGVAGIRSCGCRSEILFLCWLSEATHSHSLSHDSLHLQISMKNLLHAESLYPSSLFCQKEPGHPSLL